jgi:hypothetical protein
MTRRLEPSSAPRPPAARLQAQSAALALLALASAAHAQTFNFIQRTGQVTTYCGSPFGGPLQQHDFTTPQTTHDTISVSDDGGGGARPPSSGTASLDADVTPTLLIIRCQGSSHRGVPAGPAYATADSRDNWTFTLTQRVCFSLHVELEASCTNPNIPAQAFNLVPGPGGAIELSDGTHPSVLTHAISTPGSWIGDFSGTLAPGQYGISVFGRSDGNGYPFDGAFSNSISLDIGGTTFTDMPDPATACGTGTAPFSVAAAGPGPFSYRWQIEALTGIWRDITTTPVSLPCGGSVRATTPTAATTDIGINPCTGATVYRVRCMVTSPCGSVASDAATYTVCAADINCDGQPDFFDYLDFAALFDAEDPAADYNHDGTIDFFDYLDFASDFAAGC